MKKIICSSFFYLFATVMVVLLCCNSFTCVFISTVMFLILYFIGKALGKEVMYEIMGINWLQKTFKNNPVIMDLKNE